MKVLWSMAVLVLLVALVGPAAAGNKATPAVAVRSRVTFQIAKTVPCRKCNYVKTCGPVSRQVCKVQRICHPLQKCWHSRVGNMIRRRCQSICQWVTHKICQWVTRRACRYHLRCTVVVCVIRG